VAEISELKTMTTSQPLPPTFTGIRRVAIDINFRFALPNQIVDRFKNEFIMTIDQHNQLVMFTEERFNKLGEEMLKERHANRGEFAIARATERICALAEYVKADSNNRVQIPETFRKILKDEVDLPEGEVPAVDLPAVDLPEGEVYLIGALDKLMVLSTQGYKKYFASTVKNRDLQETHARLLRLDTSIAPTASGGAR